MRQVTRLTIIAVAAMLLAGPARADATLFGARVGALDAPALAQFYESVFGLKEIERIEFPDFLEILMNFGDSVEAARANPGPRVIVMKRASDDLDDPIPHLALNVTDMKATMKAVKGAGGTLQGEPHEFGKTGILILFGIDPAGNKFEMIQPPR